MNTLDNPTTNYKTLDYLIIQVEDAEFRISRDIAKYSSLLTRMGGNVVSDKFRVDDLNVGTKKDVILLFDWLLSYSNIELHDRQHIRLIPYDISTEFLPNEIRFLTRLRQNDPLEDFLKRIESFRKTIQYFGFERLRYHLEEYLDLLCYAELGHTYMPYIKMKLSNPLTPESHIKINKQLLEEYKNHPINILRN